MDDPEEVPATNEKNLDSTFSTGGPLGWAALALCENVVPSERDPSILVQQLQADGVCL